MSLFGCSAGTCRPCSTADPTLDTVKVTVENKENVAPVRGNCQLVEDKAAAEAVDKAAQERIEAEAHRLREVQKLEEQRFLEVQAEAERTLLAAQEEKQRREKEEASRAQEEAEEERKAQEILERMRGE